MRMIRWAGVVALGALGLAAAAFVGRVAPAEAGDNAIPVRLADAERAITIQGQGLEALRQQVITIQGENFGARIDGLDKQIAELKAELAAARKENAELRTLLGSEVARLDARITAVSNAQGGTVSLPSR